jgi:cytosine/adenosine deaminase-related metal-dependent hydrolase
MGRRLIKNADWIITMDPQRRRLQNHDILVEENKILQIDKDIPLDESISEVIRADGMIIIPGLINTHHHFFQALTRNIPALNYGLTLEQWLDINYRVFQHYNEEALEVASYASISELLKSGCTTTTDHHYVFTKRDNRMIDASIKSAQELGIRFHPTRGSISIGRSQGNYVPDRMAQSLDDILYDSERLIQTFHEAKFGSMVRIALAPCNYGLDSTPEVLDETLKLARKYKVRLHSHLAESVAETEIALAKFGCRPVEFMESQGWLGDDIWYAHCTQLNQREIELFAKTGTSVAHCPVSNMQTGVIAPVSAMLSAGVFVGMAVDGNGSNNSSNMISDMKTAYNVHALADLDTALTTQQVLEMATIGSAKVLGREDEIGSLEIGKCADLVLMNWSQIQYAGGMHDPVECIIMCGDSKMVDTVMVNGKVRVRKGKLVDIDEGAKAQWINQVGNKWFANAYSKQ